MSDLITVVLKIVERCNLDCAYCYMYHAADQSWRERPVFLAERYRADVIRILAEHAERFPHADLVLGIHGGEPLLLGKKAMRSFLTDVRNVLASPRLAIAVQTNAVLLDREWLTILSDLEASISISCDGPPVVNDVFRLYRNGRSTGKIIEDAIRLCLAWPDKSLLSGVLAVANPNTSGAEVVRYFYGLGVRRLDFLLPDANYVSPPAHLPDYSHARMLQYLEEAFDEWVAIGSPEFKIRIFEHFVRRILGTISSLDCFGGDLSSVAVVESDGSYHLLDVLHICGDGASRTPLHVSSHSLQEYMEWASSADPGPCSKCRKCRAFSACGGGYLPHRFDGKSYDNPSFYCDVLFELYRYIKTYLYSVTPECLWRKRETAATSVTGD